jgi:hypothetical protein
MEREPTSENHWLRSPCWVDDSPPGIVRVGNTVRRTPEGNAAFVHDVLLFLEDRDFPFAPCFLGMDERGRDILSYLEGETWSGSSSGLSDDLLVQVTRVVRRYHDATASEQARRILCQTLIPFFTIHRFLFWTTLRGVP